MSLRVRLTLVVTVVAAMVLALSISVALEQIEARIVGDATDLAAERFAEEVFTPTFFDDETGELFGWDATVGMTDEIAEAKDDWIEGAFGDDDGFESESFGAAFVEEWFLDDEAVIAEDFAFAVTLDELDELAAVTKKMRTRQTLGVPWEWFGLSVPGEDGGGLVALRDLSLISVESDGSLQVVAPSEGLSSLMETGWVRLPRSAGGMAGVAEEFEDGIESLFIEELLFSTYLLFEADVGADEVEEDDGPESVLLVGSELFEDLDIDFPELDRIGSVAIEAPGVETAIDSVGVVKVVLWMAAALVLASLAAITWLMTGRALAPVRAMTSRVGEMGGGDLHERVPESGNGDEIDVLAKTMNGMLGRVERSDNERRRFVSDASHELRSPVAAIRSELEVARRYPEQTDWPAVAHNVEVENARLETIVTDLLTLARFDETVSAGAVTTVDLDDIVLEESHRSRALPVDVSAVSGGRVIGRPEELTAMVRHLLDNAVRHADQRVAASLTSTDSSVTLMVDDDGAGVSPEHQDAIFDRFTRLEESRARDSGGAGLGLAVVRAAATRHDGSAEVSDSPLGGARFTITLPAAV